MCRQSVRVQIAERLHEVAQEAKAMGMGQKKFLTDILNASLSSKAKLYGDVPKAVVAAGKRK